MLVTLDDILRPATVREAERENLGAALVAGVHLQVVTLKITREALALRRVEAV